MFKLKEDRLTFTGRDLANRLKKNGFKGITVQEYTMKSFSIKNWLANSGLPQDVQDKIMDLHLSADQRVKDAYNMQCLDGDCLVDTGNVILVGRK